MATYKAKPLTEEQVKHIRANYQTVSVPDMAKAINRHADALYSFMDQNNLTPFKNDPKTRGHNHPFRKANRRLESVCLKRRIEGRQHNPK